MRRGVFFMCFSANASFVVGTAVVGCGIYLLRKRKIPPRAKYLALIPIVFGIHQLAEGLVWLGLEPNLPKWVHSGAIYFYTFISHSFWPVYIPLAMAVYDRVDKYRRADWFFLFIGLFVSAYLFWSYTFYDPVVLKTGLNLFQCNSLIYDFDIPIDYGLGRYLYLSAIIIPLVTTTNKKIRYILSPVLILTFLLASFFSGEGSFSSVWCFFAASISCIFVLIFPVKKGSNKFVTRKA